jgi:hypothetical protein
MIIRAEWIRWPTACAVLATASQAIAAGDVPGTKYYESLARNDCPAANQCFVTFANVPTGFWLMATNLSCQVSIAPPGAYTRVTLIVAPFEKLLVKGVFTASPVQPGAAGSMYYLNEEMKSFFREGRTPQAYVDNATANLRLDCKLSGNLVTP